MRRFMLPVLTILTVTALMALRPAPVKPPATIEEAASIAESRGLHVLGNHVSRSATSFAQANVMRVGQPAENWVGHARVLVDVFEEVQGAEHLAVARWGKMLVYGDPVLVAELTKP